MPVVVRLLARPVTRFHFYKGVEMSRRWSRDIAGENAFSDLCYGFEGCVVLVYFAIFLCHSLYTSRGFDEDGNVGTMEFPYLI